MQNIASWSNDAWYNDTTAEQYWVQPIFWAGKLAIKTIWINVNMQLNSKKYSSNKAIKIGVCAEIESTSGKTS